MKRAVVIAAIVLLAGCSSGESEPDAGSSGSVSVPSVVETPTQSAAPTATQVATATPTAAPASSKPAPRPTAAGKGDENFCDYLAQAAQAQQTIENPDQLVALVEGAQAVAPGAIAEDMALYTLSVRKLALTVTGNPDEAAKADAWLSRNDAAISAAEANINSYSESTCGSPFIGGGD